VSKYPLRPLGDALSLDIDEIPIDPDTQYPIAGVYGFGRGLFHREPILGSQTGYKKLYRLHVGRIVMSRLKAFEGAISYIPEQFSGSFLSSEFPTFEVKEQIADIQYVSHICGWPEFWGLLQQGSKGIGARRERVHAERLLSIKVPLPDLDEQRRVATKLNAAMSVVARLAERQVAQSKMCTAASDAIVSTVFQRGVEAGWPLRKIGEIAEINPRLRRPSPDTVVAFVPMVALSEITGRIEFPEYRETRTLDGGYKQFERGDLIFAKITPCMQNGKSAVFFDSRAEIGFGSTEFHVVRPSNDVLSEWIHAWVRSRDFRLRAMLAFTGTAGQQRVLASFLKKAMIPVPPTESEQRDRLSFINRIHKKRLHCRNLEISQQERLRALRHSLLNAAFNGQL
jgi:type I restriction enzyme S subunit